MLKSFKCSFDFFGSFLVILVEYEGVEIVFKGIVVFIEYDE